MKPFNITAVALITLSTAVAIAFTLLQKKMSTKEKAIAAVGDELPSGFIVGSFTNSRSQELYTIRIPRKDLTTPPKAMLFLAHGIAEHCCRPGYLLMYQSLATAGVDVYSMDYHGHGRSDGEPRGYAEKFDHFVDDLVEYVDACKKKYTDKGETVPPLLLMGQSMGGLVSVKTALRSGSDQFAGIVLTGPALGIDMSLEIKVQKFFGPLIDSLFPKAKIVDAVRPKDLSRNKDAVQAFIDDPLCSKGKLVARTAIGMDKNFDIIRERRGEVSCPILILHGTDDKCTSHNATHDFFENVGTPVEKKRYLQLPGLYHELYEEPETDQLLESIVAFASSGGKEFATVEGEEKDGVINVRFQY